MSQIPRSLPEIKVIYITHDTIRELKYYIESRMNPKSPLAALFNMAPKEFIDKFPDECPPNTIALIRNMDDSCAVVKMTEEERALAGNALMEATLMLGRQDKPKLED